MKPSGKHKHDKDNPEGLHTHDFDELGEEGLKLLVKGKLKNLPNFSFKKAKTEKQKKEAEEKKEEKKKNKKEQLNELIDTIENNFSKFQSKKQVAQQQSGSSVPIPIYIPQYTAPTDKNLNVENLTDINNMILKKENELKEYYEKEFKKKWSEVEENYIELENRALEEDKEIAFREPILPQPEELQPEELQPEEEPILPEIKPEPSPLQLQIKPIEEFEKEFEFIQPELIPTRQFEYMPEEESLEDKVMGLLDIFDDEVLRKFQKADPKIETLEKLNEEQQEIIDSKQNQLNQLVEMESNLREALNLDRQSIEKIEKELMEKIEEANLLSDENERLQKIKEAEILSIQLDGANNIAQLTEELGKVADERDKIKEELESLKFMNLFKPEQATDAQEQLIEMNITPAEQQLLTQETKEDSRAIFLREILPENLIPKQRNRLNSLYETIRAIETEIGENELDERISIILGESPNIRQSEFMIEINKERKSIIDRFREAEELQFQQIQERVAEMENEERMVLLAETEERRENILKSIETIKEKESEIEDDINEKEKELEEFINEYESLVLTIETELQNKGVEEVEDIYKNVDDRERENLLVLVDYINERKNQIKESIEGVKEILENGKQLLEKRGIELAEKEEDLNYIDREIETLQKELL
jgi:hypothetical protein